MADLPPLLEPSAHGLPRHDPLGGRMLQCPPGEIPDLTFALTAVASLSKDQYCEWHFLGPSETGSGELLPIQELGRIRARRVDTKKIEVVTCALLQFHEVVDDEFPMNIEKAAGALQTMAATTGWEVVYVGEF